MSLAMLQLILRDNGWVAETTASDVLVYAAMHGYGIVRASAMQCIPQWPANAQTTVISTDLRDLVLVYLQ